MYPFLVLKNPLLFFIYRKKKRFNILQHVKEFISCSYELVCRHRRNF